MPIFPTYQGVSTSIAGGAAPKVDITDPLLHQTEKLGRAVEGSAITFNEVMKKRQALTDEADAYQRYVQADKDLNDLADSFNKPEIGRKAREVFDQVVEKKKIDWYKDLSPGAAQSLERKLSGKLIEYQTNARKIENRVHLNEYQAGGIQASILAAEAASRRTGPEDGADTKEFKDYSAYLEVGRANGYYTPQEVESEKQKTLSAGAASRVYKVTASDSQDEVTNVLDIFKQEKAEPGSTFLKNIEPNKRVELQKSLQSRLEHLQNQDLARIREERIETDKRHAEEVKATTLRAQQMLDNPGKYGALTQEWLDEKADLRLLDASDYNRFGDNLQKNRESGTLMTGGRGNPEVVNYFASRVYSTKSTGDAAAVMGELKASIARGDVPSGQGQPGQVWLSHLDSLTRIPRDQDITPAKQTSDAKREVELALRTTGPMAQYLKRTESDAIGAINKALDVNAIQGYPEPPQSIIDRMLPAARARVGQPAQQLSTDTRRSLGLPVTADPKERRESLRDHTKQLLQQYDAAPPGPEGNEIRATIKQALTDLRLLHDAEEAQAKQKAAIEASRGGSGGSSAGTQQKSGGPLVGPRR